MAPALLATRGGKQHESIHPRLVTSRGDHPCRRRGTSYAFRDPLYHRTGGSAEAVLSDDGRNDLVREYAQPRGATDSRRALLHRGEAEPSPSVRAAPGRPATIANHCAAV